MQEQEPSVNDILSSIRQILTNKIDGDNQNQIPDSQNGASYDETQGHSTQTDDQMKTDSFTEDVLLLTDDMIIGSAVKESHSFDEMGLGGKDMPLPGKMTPTVPLNEGISPSAHGTLVNIPVTPDQLQADLKNQIDAWLDKNLPQIVERIVSEEVRHIFNKR